MSLATRDPDKGPRRSRCIVASVTSEAIDGSTTASLRLVNTRTVLAQLREARAPRTLGELAAATGLTRPTIEGALMELGKLALTVEESPLRETGVTGRPGRRWRFAPEAWAAAGIDLRPDRIRVEVVDMSGAITGAASQGSLSLDDPHAAVTAACDQVHAALRRSGLPEDLLQAVAVSVPGVVDQAGRLWKSEVVPRWVDAGIADMLSTVLPHAVPVALDNAANHAALAESTVGVGIGASSMVFVLVDEGIGTATILDGRLIRGARGAAGEVGAIRKMRWSTAAERLLRRTGAPSLDVLFDFPASSGRARDALVDFATDIAAGTAAMVLAIDPELVVMGGIVSRADESFFDVIRERLAGSVLYPPTVVRASLGDGAVVRGASLQALRTVEAVRFP